LTSGADRHSWRIPQDISSQYVEQMTSEQCVDGKWQRVKRDNHLWDCEVMQVLCSRVYGLWVEGAELPELQEKPPAAAPEIKPQAPVQMPQPVRPPRQPALGPKCPYCGKGVVVNQECTACRAGVSGTAYGDGFDKAGE
jgi:hypothetical protein